LKSEDAQFHLEEIIALDLVGVVSFAAEVIAVMTMVMIIVDLYIATLFRKDPGEGEYPRIMFLLLEFD